MPTSRDGWHLDKKVPISIIVALFAQFFGGILFVARLDTRITTLEGSTAQQAVYQRDRDDRQDKARTEALELIRHQLEVMDAKIDRLIEARIRQP